MSGAHVSFRAKADGRFEEEVDFVVVGSGAGGSAAAVQLARGGAKVAIVEAGAWRDPTDYPFSAYGALRDLMWNFSSQLTTGRAMWPIVQASAVGGTTVINSAICVRTPDDIFAMWSREFGINGLRDGVLAAEDRVERELSVEEVPVAARGLSNTLAKKGADELHWSDSHYMRRYVKGCVGSGQCLQGCRGLKKQSTNLNYIPEVIERGGLVVSCAPVDRVTLHGARATGVTGRFLHPTTRRHGARFSVRAKKAVVVAASVTQSPLLLRRSGLKLPAIGSYFRAHPGTGIMGCYDQPVDMNVGATQGWASIAFRENPGLKLEVLSLPPEMVASRVPGAGQELMKRLEAYRHYAMWCLAVRAESVGTISESPFGNPVVRYTLNDADMHRFRQGLILVARQHVAAGARSILPNISGLPVEIPADKIEMLQDAPLDPRRYIGILSHLFGGCVMGRDPASSVVDERGRVHGFQGLVVADASAIPSNLGVNPQHTIMGLASVFADHLLAAA